MTEQKWKEICTQLQPLMDALREITEENEIEHLHIATSSVNHSYSVFMIDDKTKEHFDLLNFSGRAYTNYKPFGGIGNERDRG